MFEKGKPRHANAGRKKGTPNKRTTELVAKVEATGKTPLEVILEDMRAKYDGGDLEGAANRARDAAPYVHARLSSSDVSVRRIRDVADLSTAELIALVGEEGTGEEAGGSKLIGRVH